MQARTEEILEASPELVPPDWSQVTCAECNCDWMLNPEPGVLKPKSWCKHIAASFYELVHLCDLDPQAIFMMRGLDIHAMGRPCVSCVSGSSRQSAIEL